MPSTIPFNSRVVFNLKGRSYYDDIDDDIMCYFAPSVKNFDKGFYMHAQEYEEWVKLFCGEPEEPEREGEEML